MSNLSINDIMAIKEAMREVIEEYFPDLKFSHDRRQVLRRWPSRECTHRIDEFCAKCGFAAEFESLGFREQGKA